MADVTCFIAHPDDELFCAGLLGLLSERGVNVHLVCLTRGEGARCMGDPPKATPATIGTVRAREMQCSARALDAASLTFLDYDDPRAGPDGLRAPTIMPQKLQETLQSTIQQQNSLLVITHGSGGEYGHPAHCLLHDQVVASLAAMNAPPPLVTFAAFHPSHPHPGMLNRAQWADIVLDSSAATGKKEQVLTCHQTQWEVFVGQQENHAAYQRAITSYALQHRLEGYAVHTFSQHTNDPLRQWIRDHEYYIRRSSIRRALDPIRKGLHYSQYYVRNIGRSIRNTLSQ